MTDRKVNSATPRARRGNVGCAVFIGFVALVSTAIVVVLVTLHLRRAETHNWPQVACTIVASEVVGREGPDTTGPYSLEIRYRYRINGVDHEGSRWRLDEPSGDDVAELWRIAHRYAPGDRTVVHVDPDDPTVAVLEPGGSRLLMVIAIVPAVIVLVALVGLWQVVRGRRDATTDPDAARSVLREGGTGAHPILSRFALLCFFGFFFGFGGIFSWIFVIRPALLAREAQAWPVVDCVVIASAVRSHRGSDSTTYSADILYEYALGGVTHRANRYGTLGGSTSDQSHWARIVRDHPPGHRTTCLVDPDDPYRAILDASPPKLLSVGSITFIFPLVGLIGIVGTLGSMRNELRRSRGTRAAGGRAVERPSVDVWRSPFDRDARSAPPDDHPTDLGAEPRVLQPSESPVTRAVFLALFAAVWNGMVWWLLVPEAVGQWSSGFGFGTLFMSAFALVFVAVGLLVVALAIHAFLALANPRIVLKPRRAHFRLGEEMMIDWECVGGRRKIRRLTIELVGREAATYTQGSTTSTARHEFLVETLLDADDPQSTSIGTLAFTPPMTAVPSFKAPRNAIEWLLRVKGEIPMWPDVTNEYVIEVLGPREFPRVASTTTEAQVPPTREAQ